MRYETAQVPSDPAGVFANAQSAGFVIDDPDAEYRIVSVKTGNGRHRLINKALRAVMAVIFLRH